MADYNDDAEKTLQINQGEIGALKKAIMYLKFSCEETESLMYAASPFINSVFAKIIEIDDFGQFEKDFYNERNLDSEGFVLSKINKMEQEMGRPFDKETKEASFKECIYPFSTS